MRRPIFPFVLSLFLLVGAFVYPVAFQAEHGFEQITVTATGNAGQATGTVTSSNRFVGEVEAVYIDYGGSVTSTTDITIATVSPALNILVRANSATDGWFYPTVQQHNSSASTVTWYKSTPINDKLRITAGQSTSGTVAVLTVFYGN